ncbi:hypothetical protein FHS83_001165 [Rhizomicrobium palustre]|uniref:Right handed beta helix domain-containing protein n=1 Tax=Rhizomicrobium palustre TaxID=189966 RepID=A0A846MXZ2_9PROT|nr:FG-GAP-like repeat-containing protein [Rhizomicrobium palustre]NIK87847.1 hypothetical protein [Rhizomicrobium palustre]
MAIITIGKGKMYSCPYYAAPHVQAGDTVEIYPGTYGGAWFWSSNITIKGMGPGVVIQGTLTQGKGLFVLSGPNVTVDNITFKNANNYDGNGAGINFTGTNLTVTNSTFLNNQDGILTTPNGGSTITVKNSTFDGNGSNAGAHGAAHGIYAGTAALLDVENSTFTNTLEGHSIKSRAKNTIIKNNTITDGPNGTSSYLIDIPNGGAATITGNYLEKGPKSSNSSYAITMGEEGVKNPAGTILIADNTFVNDDKAGVVFAHNETGNADFTVSNNKISGLATTILTGKGTVIDPNISTGTTTRPPGAPEITAKPLAADFNTDGKGDIVLQNKSGQVMVWTMNGTEKTGAAALRDAGANLKVIAAADFNGDGKTDILLQNNYADVQIWTFNGIGLTSAVTVPTKIETSWHAIGAGDFNGDGKADILFQNNDHRVWVWTMNGTTKTGNLIVGNPGVTWNTIGAADFDGNGKSDILFQNVNTGAVQIWTMDGTTVLSKTVVSTPPGSGFKAVATGDLDGDSRADILFQDSSGQVLVWTMNGTAVKSASVIGTPGAGWSVAGTDDYNGDGKDDILFQNSTGQTMAWTMSGTSVLSKGPINDAGTGWHAIAG